jgi:hypothetical protein
MIPASLYILTRARAATTHTYTHTHTYKSNDFVDLFNPTTIHLCCTTIILLLPLQLLYKVQCNDQACAARAHVCDMCECMCVVGEVYHINILYIPIDRQAYSRKYKSCDCEYLLNHLHMPPPLVHMS